jgi:MFS family permease
VNAVIARDLAGEFALSPADLGLLTSAYFLAFAAFQIPLGVLLDRFGSRCVLLALLLIVSAGGLLFGLAPGVAALRWARAGPGGIGLPDGPIKAFTLWFPLSRLATLNGGSSPSARWRDGRDRTGGGIGRRGGWRACLRAGGGCAAVRAHLLRGAEAPLLGRVKPGAPVLRIGAILSTSISGASRCRWSSCTAPIRRCRLWLAPGSRT